MAAMVRWLMFAAGVMSAGVSAAENAAVPSLRATLSSEEFAKAGLHKLTPEELTALETALAAHRPAAQRPSASTRDMGAEQVAVARAEVDAPKEMRTRVEGTVGDLTGRSVFVLENGQVWQQRIPDKISVPRPLVNPTVTVTRGLAGYKMDIDGLTRTVFVKRIQ